MFVFIILVNGRYSGQRLASSRWMAWSPADEAGPCVTALASPGRSFTFLLDRNELWQRRRTQFSQAHLYRASVTEIRCRERLSGPVSHTVSNLAGYAERTIPFPGVDRDLPQAPRMDSESQGSPGRDVGDCANRDHLARFYRFGQTSRWNLLV
jgi:hypothetical protein